MCGWLTKSLLASVYVNFPTASFSSTSSNQTIAFDSKSWSLFSCGYSKTCCVHMDDEKIASWPLCDWTCLHSFYIFKCKFYYLFSWVCALHVWFRFSLEWTFHSWDEKTLSKFGENDLLSFLYLQKFACQFEKMSTYRAFRLNLRESHLILTGPFCENQLILKWKI